jgi:hypothetical protein
VLVKYRDDGGNVRVGIVRDHINSRNHQQHDDSNDESSDEHPNAHLHEYSHRDGPHEQYDSVHDIYNISSDEDKNHNDKSDEEHHDSSSESHEDEHQPSYHHYRHHQQPRVEINKKKNRDSSEEVQVKHTCKNKDKNNKVFVYKQPKIRIPILVQPPPLVVHQPAPKPVVCQPKIRYTPPNIRLQPVIVKIKKPKTTTTTTTTHCPKTTKRVCKKCRRKPSRKCNRCQKRKQDKHHSVEYKAYSTSRHEGILT